MMKFKHSVLTLSAVMSLSLIAGCSSSDAKPDASGNNNSVGKDENSEPKASELLNAVKDAKDDDAALEAWNTLLLNSASSTGYNFELETDGEDYAYNNDDAEGNVDRDEVYEIGTEGWFISEGEEDSYALNLTSIDGSDDNYLEGFGTIDYINPDGIMLTVKLSDTELKDFQGTVESITNNGGDISNITRDDAALNLMMDSMANVGYQVNVDPFHNSSLYTIDVKQDGDSWILSAKVKDPQTYIQAASNKALLYANRTDRPSLGVDELKDESWEFRFTSEGVLKEVMTNIDHVIYKPNADATQGNPTYLSIMNKTEFKKADESELDIQGVKDLCKSAKDGSLKEGSEFHLEDK